MKASFSIQEKVTFKIMLEHRYSFFTYDDSGLTMLETNLIDTSIDYFIQRLKIVEAFLVFGAYECAFFR